MQAVNLLTIEWLLKVKGSNIYHYVVQQTLSLIKKSEIGQVCRRLACEQQTYFRSSLFSLRILFSRWVKQEPKNVSAPRRLVGAHFFSIQIYHPFKLMLVQIRLQLHPGGPGVVNRLKSKFFIKIVSNQVIFIDCYRKSVKIYRGKSFRLNPDWKEYLKFRIGCIFHDTCL